MLEWKILHDCDTDTGEPTCFTTEVNSEMYGKYIWLTENKDGNWDVEFDNGSKFIVLKTCKTVLSGKRWVARNLRR